MARLWQGIVVDKFSKPAVVALLLLTSLFLSFIVSTQGYLTGIFIIGALVALPLAYATVANPEFGIAAFIVIAFVINYSARFVPEPTPLGLIMDFFTYLLILGFFVRQRKERDWSRFKNPITYLILFWLGYNLLEALNPASPQILEWVYTIRTVAFIMLMYFVFLFHIRSKKYIKLLFKIWLIMALLGALAGFQQEFIGLFSAENEWVHRYPERFKLLFIQGHLRKWGIFSDPVVFAYNMVVAAVLCLSLIIGRTTPRQKVALGCTIFFCISIMLYTGTRAAYVMIPSALGMLAILKFSRQMMIAVVVVAAIFGFLIMVPTSNATLYRFQSAFKPSKDPSFEERARNQARIRPYILSHPIGGGLGSVGVWGARFAPNSYLAKFPPDSGYVRVAVELGWLGLLFYCIFNFVILYQGIKYYYLIRDPELKIYCMAMVLVIFAFDIGNYPQQALVQYPSNILFYLAMAIINVTMRLDLEQRQNLPQQQESSLTSN